MAQHEWRTRAELEEMPAVAELFDGCMPAYACVRCGAIRNLKDGEQLPADGCLAWLLRARPVG